MQQQAIVYTRTGSSDVLELVTREVGEPGPGEVRVRIVASGVNPTDWKNRAGATATTALAAEQTPNQDGAGIVDAVGAGVTQFAVGDRVWTYLSAYQRPSGSAMEYAVLDAGHVAPLPDGVSFDVGASLGVPAMTAHRALTVTEGGPSRLAPGVLSGHVVLVTGGAGAVGHAAIQLARWAGATVIATVSGAEKAALAAAAGAHHVVNYREEDVVARVRELSPRGVDTIVDVAIATNLEADLAVLRSGGTVAIYANTAADEVTVPIRGGMGINARFQFVLLYTVGEAALVAAAEDVTSAAAAGALPVGEEHGLPLIRYPLAETAAAHDAVEQGAIGKVLIDVTEERA